jgi:hypothetical protein
MKFEVSPNQKVLPSLSTPLENRINQHALIRAGALPDKDIITPFFQTTIQPTYKSSKDTMFLNNTKLSSSNKQATPSTLSYARSPINANKKNHRSPKLTRHLQPSTSEPKRLPHSSKVPTAQRYPSQALRNPTISLQPTARHLRQCRPPLLHLHHIQP